MKDGRLLSSAGRDAAGAALHGDGVRRLWLAFAALLAATFAGTVGYRVVEGASWDDALFMTVITLSTVGYGEVVPLSPAGRVLTMVLIVVGMTVVFAAVGAWVRVLFEGEMENALGRRRLQKMLREMSGHFIICGYGRFGRRLVEELRERGESFVVIDHSSDLPPEIVALKADATEENVLKEAGIGRAKALLAALPSDADNVYITLTAKELNPSIFVVSRCEQESGEGRLRRAGADRVVAPYAIGGHRMVELALHPMLVEFGDVLNTPDRQPVSLAEISIVAGSRLDGLAGKPTELLQRYGVMPVGVIGADGRLQVGVSGHLHLKAGTTLVVFGSEKGIEAVAEAGKAAAS